MPLRKSFYVNDDQAQALMSMPAAGNPPAAYPNGAVGIRDRAIMLPGDSGGPRHFTVNESAQMQNETNAASKAAYLRALPALDDPQAMAARASMIAENENRAAILANRRQGNQPQIIPLQPGHTGSNRDFPAEAAMRERMNAYRQRVLAAREKRNQVSKMVHGGSVPMSLTNPEEAARLMAEADKEVDTALNSHGLDQPQTNTVSPTPQPSMPSTPKMPGAGLTPQQNATINKAVENAPRAGNGVISETASAGGHAKAQLPPPPNDIMDTPSWITATANAAAGTPAVTTSTPQTVQGAITASNAVALPPAPPQPAPVRQIDLNVSPGNQIGAPQPTLTEHVTAGGGRFYYNADEKKQLDAQAAADARAKAAAEAQRQADSKLFNSTLRWNGRGYERVSPEQDYAERQNNAMKRPELNAPLFPGDANGHGYTGVNAQGQRVVEQAPIMTPEQRAASDARAAQLVGQPQLPAAPPAPAASPVASPAAPASPPRINSQAEYDALPSGAHYYDSNGRLGRKP